MNILVKVEQGEIRIHEPRSAPSCFRKEPDAALHLARRVAETAAPVAFHMSCSNPGEHGMPRFSKAAFAEDVKDNIYKIQQADRASPRI